MELKQLSYFVAVAEEGSITAAARRLYISQPPLSTQMKLLEQELGCQLFERGRSAIRLTEQGAILYRHALTLLEISRAARDEVLSSTGEVRGTLRLGVVSSVVSSHGADWIARFVRACPQARVEVCEANTYELLEKLRNRAIQLAIVRTPFRADRVSCRSLLSEPMVAIGPAAMLPEAEVTPQALAALPLISYRRWKSVLKQYFDEDGLSPAFRCLCDDARTAVSLAEAGLGVCIAPQSAATQGSQSLVSRPLTRPIRSEVVLVSPEDGQLSPAARRFAELLEEKET